MKLPHHCILFLFTICTVSQLFWNRVCTLWSGIWVEAVCSFLQIITVITYRSNLYFRSHMAQLFLSLPYFVLHVWELQLAFIAVMTIWPCDKQALVQRPNQMDNIEETRWSHWHVGSATAWFEIFLPYPLSSLPLMGHFRSYVKYFKRYKHTALRYMRTEYMIVKLSTRPQTNWRDWISPIQSVALGCSADDSK